MVEILPNTPTLGTITALGTIASAELKTGQTTVTLSAAPGAPYTTAGATFHLLIGEPGKGTACEVVIAEVESGAKLKLTRKREGTTEGNWPIGTAVYPWLTEEALETYISEHAGGASATNKPQLLKATVLSTIGGSASQEPAVGSTLIVAVAEGGTGRVTGITGCGTWSRVAEVTGTGKAWNNLSVWVCSSSTGVPETVVVSHEGENTGKFIYMEWAGLTGFTAAATKSAEKPGSVEKLESPYYTFTTGHELVFALFGAFGGGILPNLGLLEGQSLNAQVATDFNSTNSFLVANSQDPPSAGVVTPQLVLTTNFPTESTLSSIIFGFTAQRGVPALSAAGKLRPSLPTTLDPAGLRSTGQLPALVTQGPAAWDTKLLGPKLEAASGKRAPARRFEQTATIVRMVGIAKVKAGETLTSADSIILKLGSGSCVAQEFNLLYGTSLLTLATLRCKTTTTGVVTFLEKEGLEIKAGEYIALDCEIVT